jgi:excisionase family DNA binding protein
MTQLMTLPEVAQHLRVHPTMIRRLLKSRQLPAFKVGRQWRFDVQLIDRWRSQLEADTPRRGGAAK